MLLKHYVLEGTLVDFWEDNSWEVLCSHWPTNGGATFRMSKGMNAKEGEVYGPGDILDLQAGILTGHYEKKRWVEVIKSGYTLCLMSNLNCRAKTRIVDSTNFVLPLNTRAIPLENTVYFNDQGVDKAANQYNLILDRPYPLQLVGTGKIMVINIEDK